MEAEYRRHYRDLFERHWWWRARSEFIIAALQRLHLDAQRTSILDVGCGDGLFFEQLSRFGKVEGIDVEEALSPNSRWREQIHSGPFDDSFQPQREYSVVLMLDVLEHLPAPHAALRNVRRLLADDGFFLATVPAFQAAWTSHDVLNQHVARFTKSSMRTLLEGEGFRITEQGYFFHGLWGAKLLVRAYETLSPREPQVPKVPATWINQLLYRFSRLEQATLGRLPMPFGSSLIVLARNASREASQVLAANEGNGATTPANKA